MTGLGNGWEQKGGAGFSHAFKTRGSPGLCAFPSWLPACRETSRISSRKQSRIWALVFPWARWGKRGVSAFLLGAKALSLGIALSHRYTARWQEGRVITTQGPEEGTLGWSRCPE